MILQTLTPLRNVNKALLLSLPLFFCASNMNSQTMTDAEITSKMYEAFALNKEKKTAEALDAFLLVGEQTAKQQTEDERQVYVCSQLMACSCLQTLKRYEEGYRLAKKLMEGKLLESERKNVESEYAYNGYMYAVDFIKTDKTRSEHEYGRQILSEIAPYANDFLRPYILPKIPYSWYADGASYFISAEYDKALTCFRNAYEGYMKLDKHVDAVKCLREMAGCQRWLYDFSGAVDALKSGLTLAEKAGLDDVQMECLKDLWTIYDVVGDVRQTLACGERMDSLVEASSDLKTKFAYYNQKGKEAEKQGRYAIAEQWYLRGKDIAESEEAQTIYASRHLSYANLRGLYTALGKYDDAIVYAKKAIEVFQSQTPKGDASYNMSYATLADIYRLKGDKADCYACLTKLFEGTESMTEPRELYSRYVTRALCRVAFKDYAAGLDDFRKADSLLATKYPPEDGNRVALLALIGGAEHKMGKYADSEQHYREYADRTRGLYGENSLEHINARIFLANAEGFAGHEDEGCKDYAEAEQQLKAFMKQRIPYMNTAEREGLWSPLSALFTNMAPFAITAKQCQTPFTKTCYDALVLSKSFLLESERSMYDVIKRKGTAEDLRDFMSLSGMKNTVKALEKDYKANADSILDISQRVSRMENQLTARCRSYSDGTGFMDVDYDAVKQALGQDEVLIDFTDYMSESEGRKYAAFIIDKEQDYPLLKPLFAERQIDSLGIVRPDMYYGEDYAKDIVRLLWQPLKDNLKEGSTVYYVPSQLLFQVSLESLPMEDGSLLGSHYDFVRLSSARELVKMKRHTRRTDAHTAVLYGGLQYDMDDTAMENEAKKYDLDNLFAQRGDMARGDSVYHELQGTKEEIFRIYTILKGKKWNVVPYMGTDGTEESFLAMHGKSPCLLHLATHGFYYTPSKAADVNYLKGYTDAMSLSGLVLSGGNAAWLGKKLPKGVLGGILTANDIARLDLSNTDMVVLSACQTGQGKATSEGLYGLQRAFKKAGVGTIVMSLWNVDDRVTSEFMATFYERLTDKANALDKRKAFEEAKQIVRKNHPDPYHWAAFVMLD